MEIANDSKSLLHDKVVNTHILPGFWPEHLMETFAEMKETREKASLELE